jgi:diketogulonate reductase-like aldo/keto reductase
MNYAKVENGRVTQIGLPITGKLKDGSTVSGYNLLDEAVLQVEGWVPLTDNQPVYNPETEYLEHAGYTISETEIVVNYLVKQIVPVFTTPTTEERLAAVEEALLMII